MNRKKSILFLLTGLSLLILGACYQKQSETPKTPPAPVAVTPVPSVSSPTTAPAPAGSTEAK